MSDENAISLLVEYRNEIERLKAENERRDMGCSTCEKCGWYTCEHSGTPTHIDEISRLKAENAALVKERDELRAKAEKHTSRR